MQTFQEYLKEKHSETYMGTDDSMPEAFYDWLEIIDTDEMMSYADEFKTLAEQSLVQRVKDRINKTMDKLPSDMTMMQSGACIALQQILDWEELSIPKPKSK